MNKPGVRLLLSTKPSQHILRRGLEEFFEGGVSLPEKQIVTGRAWRASELRGKSFEDLHKLWYVNLKERNLLATQKAEAKRHSIPKEYFSNIGRFIKCKKNMAKILSVLNERRLQWELAKTELEKRTQTPNPNPTSNSEPNVTNPADQSN